MSVTAGQDSMYYYIMSGDSGNDCDVQRKFVKRVTDDPLSPTEKTIIGLCESLADKDKEIAGLKKIAEDRALFINNGVELGFIKLPDADTPDPAHKTYAMCQLTIEQALKESE